MHQNALTTCDRVIITLSNGKRVANFSSPHSFTFEDYTILPAVSNECAEDLKVTYHEDVDSGGDVKLAFTLSKKVWDEMEYWQNVYYAGGIDVVFCPLPMLQAIKNYNYDLKNSPFRSVRIEDRINKLVSIEKQCI